MTTTEQQAVTVAQEDISIGEAVYCDFLMSNLDHEHGEYEGERCAIEAAARVRLASVSSASAEAFLGEIHKRTPTGAWIAVQHHPDGDWSVAEHPLPWLPGQSPEPVPATNQAGEVAISKAVRITAYDRKDPLAIRLEFADDADRVSAADEIDLILSDAFAAARARMAASLAEARQSRDGRLIPVTRKPALATQPATSQEAVEAGKAVLEGRGDGTYAEAEDAIRKLLAATPTPPTLSEDLREASPADALAYVNTLDPIRFTDERGDPGLTYSAQQVVNAYKAGFAALARAQVKAS